MMKFKDIVKTERTVFLNSNEFAETVRIRIKTDEYIVKCVKTVGIREKTMNEKGKLQGIFVTYKSLFVRTEDLPISQIHQGTLIYVDEYRYTVASIEDQQGITLLRLEGYHQ